MTAISSTLAEPAPQCPRCAYNLTGISEPRCPECGRTLTPAEQADPNLLRPAPAWERRGRINSVYAFAATIFAVTFRPRRFLRSIRDEDWLGAAIFAALLPVAAFVLSILLSLITAKTLALVGAWLGARKLAGWSDFLIWRQGWDGALRTCIRLAIQSTAFMAVGLAVWLPTLIALDLRFWRERAPFRILGKALLYSMTWWMWCAVVMASVARLLGIIDYAWIWGFLAGGSSLGAWPLVCWLAAALTTLQFIALIWFTRAPTCRFRDLGTTAVRRAGRWLTARLAGGAVPAAAGSARASKVSSAIRPGGAARIALVDESLRNEGCVSA
ncbi:MAG TPA: hypothetical protein VGM03_04535 [Phycisphaerae bacterium]|jgi:hypothetical protein